MSRENIEATRFADCIAALDALVAKLANRESVTFVLLIDEPDRIDCWTTVKSDNICEFLDATAASIRGDLSR